MQWKKKTGSAPGRRLAGVRISAGGMFDGAASLLACSKIQNTHCFRTVAVLYCELEMGPIELNYSARVGNGGNCGP